MIVNSTLFDLAVTKLQEKQAVVPPGGGAPPMDPAMAGGAPPMDPAMMGGAPPPMDPAMAGGAPPMDPAMAGGAPPMSLGGDPMIQQIVQATVDQVMSQMGGGEAGGAGKPKAAKLDPQQILTEMAYTRRLLTHLVTELGLGMPSDILDAPMQTEGGQPEAPTAEPKMAADESDRGLAREIPPPKPVQVSANDILMDMVRRARG